MLQCIQTVRQRVTKVADFRGTAEVAEDRSLNEFAQIISYAALVVWFRAVSYLESVAFTCIVEST